ncbi:MAG: citrate lyase ACP, partial [Pyramidobacter sp.]|nr:citrate lyase ACP [Pyramidobacter sp.]
MKTASAGTLESMDCLVTVTEAAPGSGVSLEMEGSSVSRFRSA